MPRIDLASTSLRELNQQLHDASGSGANDTEWTVVNPQGQHAVAVGINAPLRVTVQGSCGYYCAGMNQLADVVVEGSVGPGVAENIMSGSVRVTGDASQYAGATGRGGLLVIEGNASSRCGISMKGVDIVVGGNIGHMSAFMAQLGRLVVCGDAGDSLGDSLYEAEIYVRGQVKSLGSDCVEKPMEEAQRQALAQLLEQAGMSHVSAGEFRFFGSARKLYHFDVDNFDAY